MMFVIYSTVAIVFVLVMFGIASFAHSIHCFVERPQELVVEGKSLFTYTLLYVNPGVPMMQVRVLCEELQLVHARPQEYYLLRAAGHKFRKVPILVAASANSLEGSYLPDEYGTAFLQRGFESTQVWLDDTEPSPDNSLEYKDFTLGMGILLVSELLSPAVIHTETVRLRQAQYALE